MDWIAAAAEEKILDAQRKGDFDQLPGKGKPLELDDDSMVPAELRIAFRLLKNAGMIPEEMQLRKEMLTLEDLLACCRDEEERRRLQGEWSAKKLRYQELMADRGWQASAAFAEYGEKLQSRLTDRNPADPRSPRQAE